MICKYKVSAFDLKAQKKALQFEGLVRISCSLLVANGISSNFQNCPDFFQSWCFGISTQNWFGA
jgi:hypothetical protein